ncbi:MAG: exopolyphosphatase [Acetatifactor sp.]
MSVKTFAAIAVGSYELTMKIFEFSGKNQMRQIDVMRRRIDLGSDTYSDGKISAEKMDELCRTLKEFSEVMKAYKVDDYRAYGTSAVRETENTTIILDQIAQRTGIRIETLSNSEQHFLDYKSVASKGENYRRIIEEKTAILDIGGGSIQISLFDNDTLVSTQNLRLGVLRIQEYLNRFNVKRSNRENFINEMVMAQLDNYKKLYLKDKEIRNLIVIDDYFSPWVIKRAEGEINRVVVERDVFSKSLEQLRGETPAQLSVALGIPEEKAPLMFVSGVLIGLIAELMDVKQIWMPGVTLCDGIAYEYAEKNHMLRGEHDFEQDIVACAMNMNKRYMGSRKRAETLENISVTIFNSMKKIHGMGRRELLFLRLAAILQECGKYISMINIGENSYQIVMATEMIGLSHQEREIVANVVRFNHSRFLYYGNKNDAWGLDRQAYLTVAKLTAILRLANGLDRSHRQKLKGLRASLKDNQLVLSVDTTEDITLEKGFFEEKSEFFREVFSVEPVLKQKKEI